MKLMGHEKITRSYDFKEIGESAWMKFKDVAISNGVCYDTFISRCRSGASPDVAASKPVKKQSPRNQRLWVGEYFDTKKGHCAFFGVNYQTVYTYMSLYELDFESALLRRLADTDKEKYDETIRRKDGRFGESGQ